jgi:hypothetical protein
MKLEPLKPCRSCGGPRHRAPGGYGECASLWRPHEYRSRCCSASLSPRSSATPAGVMHGCPGRLLSSFALAPSLAKDGRACESAAQGAGSAAS